MASHLNHWGNSTAVGRTYETAVTAGLQEYLGLDISKANEENPKEVDTKIDCKADVKFLSSPYPSNPTPAKLTPETHVTLDVSNIQSYAPNTMIFLVVDYREKGVETCGFYWISAGKVQDIMRETPVRVYKRSQRTTSDKIVKVAVSTEEMGLICFPGMNQVQTVEAIRELAAA